ncbi:MULTISPECIES: sigma-70 family RNA polymerase sigma factor [unclassified Luteococcus]|uniref:sigma-70 family RNA polymerase sigma factor n=1 Tax=unclassified Luteococcus TaxID=2639923 RepID=UPI00313A7743
MLNRVGPPGRAELDERVTALALRAGSGDRPALGEFIRLTQGDVWRFIAHLAGTQAADDLTQDTYLRAMDSLPSFEGRSPARAWLLTIARRVVADKVRREIARPQSPYSPEWLTAHAGAEDDALVLVEAAALFQTLSPERREAFVLTQLLGFSYEQAAEVCGVRIGTIRSRVARARQELVVACGDAEDAVAAEAV